ncbi:MAG TPA: hypothetical protein PLY73_02625 [Candidatus Ozemobacteraceae bacterium]|nr:hypothetical protein [Candidatus Ozemobacteraceae bacterium]
MTRHPFPFLPVLLLFVFGLLPAFALAGDYHLDVKICNDRGEEFDFVFRLDTREGNSFKSDPYTSIQPYLIRIRQICADKCGYAESEYGPEYYRMVSISRYSFTLLDDHGRIILRT